MDETHRLILQKNQAYIVKELYISENLYAILVHNGVLTNHEVAELGLPDHRRGEVC